MIQLAINGNRTDKRVPTSIEEILISAKQAIDMGASCIHFHPRNEKGIETLEAKHVDYQIDFLRNKLPNTPIGISTGEWIEKNINKKKDQIQSWKIIPDFVSVNYDEKDFKEITAIIVGKGIGIEAGLSNNIATDNFLNIFNHNEIERILIEPQEQNLNKALNNVKNILNKIETNCSYIPILIHGFDDTCWDILKFALKNGYQTRIGFEDTLKLQNGKFANNNFELFQAVL